MNLREAEVHLKHVSLFARFDGTHQRPQPDQHPAVFRSSSIPLHRNPVCRSSAPESHPPMQSSHQPRSCSRQCLSHSTATFAGSLSSLPPSTLHPHIPCWGTHLHAQKLTPSTFSSLYQVRRERVAGQADRVENHLCFLTQRRIC